MKTHKRDIRIKALKHLYENEFQIDALKSNSVTKNKDSLNLATAVLQNKKAIDDLIHQNSINWKIDRISLVDLNILRIAIYEMLFHEDKQSSKIYIDEAIEIAKEYSSVDSSKFINGILDAIMKSKSQE